MVGEDGSKDMGTMSEVQASDPIVFKSSDEVFNMIALLSAKDQLVLNRELVLQKWAWSIRLDRQRKWRTKVVGPDMQASERLACLAAAVTSHSIASGYT